VTVYPQGQSLSETSTLNFDAKHGAIANATVVPLGSGGVCVHVGGSDANVVLDAAGYVPAA
jgi:hypothetical protein